MAVPNTPEHVAVRVVSQAARPPTIRRPRVPARVRVQTFEAAFAQAFPAMFGVTPTFSALLGYQTNEGSASYRFSFGNGDDEYFYWNAGITLGFLEKWSLDLRYWDTDISDANRFCSLDTFQCDERFVATLKFTY